MPKCCGRGVRGGRGSGENAGKIDDYNTEEIEGGSEKPVACFMG